MKRLMLMFVGLFMIFSYQNALAVTNITVPDNFAEMPKEQKIIILKFLISQITEKIQEIIAKKKAFDNVNYISYIDKKDGSFKIKYPSKWQKTIYSSENVFDFKIEPLKNSEDRLLVISTPKKDIVVNTIDKKITKKVLEEMSSNAINFFKARFEFVEVITNKEILVNNSFGREIFVSYYDDMLGNKVYAKQRVIVDSKNMVLIDIQYIAKDKKKIEPIIREMIESFEVLN